MREAAQIGSIKTLYDQDGHRKYLTPAERDAFLKAADDAELREVRTSCVTLVHRSRISEALALTADRIDLKDGAIIIESAKKRQRGVYRPVPVPPTFLGMLNMVHNVRAAQKRRDRGKSVRLWNWSRKKGWYVVRAVMKAVRIAGQHATPKGLRHGFGIKAITPACR